ncbi:MAG: DUF4445 domain-containing protein [Fretibacterium sp.]|nr:DUF4445 domain-containing protein [Fretibacterium sp.]
MIEEQTYTIVFHPSGIRTKAWPGELVGTVALRAGVQIGQPCGGAGVCGKCRVRVPDGGAFLGEPSATERRLLSEKDLNEGMRLACCAMVWGDGMVQVVDGVETRDQQILESIAAGASLDWDAPRPGLGVAIDIGTTTVACCLLDLQEQTVLDLLSFLNPQIPFGDDVLSRISYSVMTPGGLEQLHKVLLGGINRACGTLAERNGARPEDIRELVVAANTVMEHTFMNVSPESIGQGPDYRPVFLEHDPVPAAFLGLELHSEALVRLIPNVAGYVGGDIVAGVVATGMEREAPLRLLVDIGTNNEIVLGNREDLLCCAAAAGPALEGACIQYGMRAGRGAIERVRQKRLEADGLEVDVIGEVEPKGICGSGLVDAVALLLREGLLDRSGRLAPPESGSSGLRARLGRTERGMVQFLLTDERSPVWLTQKDVREVQLALGAIRVGIDVMLEHRGVTLEQVDEILLAGAFGSYIDLGCAMEVGLLPRVAPSKVRGVRNSSGLGACMGVASRGFLERTKETARKMRYVELSLLPDFQRRFVKAMIF